ncbi:(4S)-4-hydroxy-5-phosphonooxypentane-2,3-dione isomerase [Pantoea ananatis]|nr:(4S)-4-hydroxy-5-phosphonooxypentane-2,3-dione isomerase [Pantoea ananatis]
MDKVWEDYLQFDSLQGPVTSTRFIIYEAYVDVKAVALHKTTPHYKNCVSQLESLMSAPRKKTELFVLMPEIS